ncbi:MAG: ubiquinone biosynthesis protein Coq4 [Patiriisocius sp.]|jgi:ubiquinone biosynthesis protein Coq4
MITAEATLQQGIDAFYEKNMSYFSNRVPISEKAKEFLIDHDVAHVIFGCDTSIYGEGVVKVWTTFGTTLGFWEVICEYKEVNAFELFRRYSFQHVAKNIFRFILAILRVIIKAKRMTKPWTCTNYELYLNTPISEIRKEFGIIIL